MVGKFRTSVLASISAAAALLIGGTASADVAMGPLPVPWDAGAGLLPSLFPESPPPGANDPNCRLTPQHPRPVVLVNSSMFTQASGFQAGAPFLRNNGYCVFTFNYGNPAYLPEIPIQAVDDVRQAGRVLAAQVDRVLAMTGAQQVDLVGHSQGGGITPLYYINVLGGAPKVANMIGISPSNHGTTMSNGVFTRSLLPPIGGAMYGLIGAMGPGLTQQAIGSDVVREVYGAGDTRPGVQYTTIVSRYDEVVTPYDNQYLDGANNILLQAGCPIDMSEHMSTMYSERAWRHVLNALDPSNFTPVPCFEVNPFFPNVR